MSKKCLKILVFTVIITIVITLTFVFSVTDKSVVEKIQMYSRNDIEKNVNLEQNIFYAMELLDDDMTEHEKALILAQYVQEGTIYSNKASDFTENVFDTHQSNDNGFNKAFTLLAQTAGLACDMIYTHYDDNHSKSAYWSLCNLDSEWTYIDVSKTDDKAYQKLDMTGVFKSRTTLEEKDASRYNFKILIDDDGIILNSWVNETYPVGVDYKTDDYSSRIYYDENNKYYILNTDTEANLYKENRNTQSKEIISSVLYNKNGTGLVKDESNLYFICTNGSLCSINTSTNENSPIELLTLNDENKKITAVFVQEGFINYSVYDESTGDIEIINYKKLSNWSILKKVELNNDVYKYNLRFLESPTSIVIFGASSIDSNSYPSGKVYLPNEINNKPVIGISKDAFKSSYGNSSFYGEVVIPENTKYIGESAFENNNFTKVELNSQLKSIRQSAFVVDQNLHIDSLIIPDSVSYIGKQAFLDIDIQNLKLGKNLRYISVATFFPTSGEVEVQEGVEYIADYAFGEYLTVLILPESLKQIGFRELMPDYVFIKSKNLEYTSYSLFAPPRLSLRGKIYLPLNSQTSKLFDELDVDYYDINVQEIKLSKKYMNVNTGDDPVTLEYELEPNYYFSEPTLTWSSSDSNVATVDQNGKVSFHNSGVATITVKTSNNGEASCEVTVLDENELQKPILYIALNKTYLDLKLNKTYKLKATITPEDTNYSKKVFWSSNDKSVVVDSEGNITAKNIGAALITAETVTGKKATCYVVVTEPTEEPITKVTLNKTELNLKIGEKAKLEATITPNDTTDSKELTWKSSNNTVATVDNEGNITAKANGTVTITVTTSNGKSATCKVVVGTGKLDYIKGDINRDEVVDVKDAREVLYMAVGMREITDEDLLIGDMNANKKIESGDSIEILRIYLRKE